LIDSIDIPIQGIQWSVGRAVEDHSIVIQDGRAISRKCWQAAPNAVDVTIDVVLSNRKVAIGWDGIHRGKGIRHNALLPIRLYETSVQQKRHVIGIVQLEPLTMIRIERIEHDFIENDGSSYAIEGRVEQQYCRNCCEASPRGDIRGLKGRASHGIHTYSARCCVICCCVGCCCCCWDCFIYFKVRTLNS
jgi:hypothetical protein